MNIKAIMTATFLCAGTLVFSHYGLAQPMTVQSMNQQLDHLYGSHNNYYDFFNQLKSNIAKQNEPAVAAVVKYPLIVFLDGQQVKILNQQQFIKHYNAIITPKIEQIVKEQQFTGLLTTYRGIAVGNGQIWFAGICPKKHCNHGTKKIIRIIGINNDI